MTGLDTSNWNDLSRQPEHRTNNPLSYHPYANIFPLLTGPAYTEFVANNRANGLLSPITVDSRNQILDGRNRHRACIDAGIEPIFESFDGSDPLDFVLIRNLHRRHLDESQRGMVAARVATLQRGDNQYTKEDSQIWPPSQAEAAKTLKVGLGTVKSARKVIDQASPELVAAVDGGSIPVSVAAQLADAAVEIQHRAVADPKNAHTIAKQVRRQERIEELAERTFQASADLGSTVYSVICADPPWRFQPWSELTGMDRAADNHYPTMTVNDLLALKPAAAKDCVLFLWATVPMLPQALDVMKSWGFTYKSNWIWGKDKIGTGYWNRNKHEMLLLGTRGQVPAPAPGTLGPSLIMAPTAEHSVKPEAFYNMIEVMFPGLSRLEMFARGSPREEWDQWGNEAPMAFGPPEQGIPIPDDPAPDITGTIITA